MDYRPTHKQLEDRGLLLESLGNSIVAAQAVRLQPTITGQQREAVAYAIDAMLQLKRELAGEGGR